MSDHPTGPADPTPGTAATAPEHGFSLRASEELIRDALSEVYDPEIGIDVVSLGLVYGVDLDDDGLLTVDMTLTSPFCPLASILQSQVHAVCSPLPGVEDIRVNLVWDPPWDPRTMASDEVKLELGIY
ncbi:MAG: metal-sulfur cluster assembly factor [Candidatus Dormibacteria bacterium]|jgi:metal-sulfur cluster biosynthetic enzyme